MLKGILRFPRRQKYSSIGHHHLPAEWKLSFLTFTSSLNMNVFTHRTSSEMHDFGAYKRQVQENSMFGNV